MEMRALRGSRPPPCGYNCRHAPPRRTPSSTSCTTLTSPTSSGIATTSTMKTTPCLLAVLTLHTLWFTGVKVFLEGAGALPMPKPVDAAVQGTDASSSGRISATDFSFTHIASSILLLLLQQKCQEWRQKGVTPLPSFCVDVGGRAEITAVQLDGYYQQYAAAVSPEERQSDLSAALYSSNSQTGGMLA